MLDNAHMLVPLQCLVMGAVQYQNNVQLDAFAEPIQIYFSRLASTASFTEQLPKNM